MIRALIVDDEPIARAGVRGMLGPDRDITVVGECANGTEALEFLRGQAVDLLLLDVQMPGLDGLGVLAALAPDPAPVTVLLTAHDQYAVRAFEARALDYVVKPFSEERFATAIARAKRTILERRLGATAARMIEDTGAGDAAASPRAAAPYLARLVVPSATGQRLVPVEEVDWIEAADYCARIRVGKQAFLVRETMDHLEERLDPDRFVRTHRSVIVNIDRVREIQAGDNGKYVLILQTGARVPLARARRERVERVLGQAL